MMPNLDTSQMLSVGMVLDGRYTIEKYLASGGFGNTYVARYDRFNSRVAVKEFFMRGINHRASDHNTVVVSNDANKEAFEFQLDKFRREAKRIFDIHNDHVVHVIDLFDANGTSYYVMDYIEGESLSTRVKRGPLTETETRNVATQLLDALEAVHASGFYHLDVKPGNIMIEEDGHCTLIDFGASKQMNALERTSLSASGIAYTPGYAPIEQEGQHLKIIGPWTDIYAVGATLYNLLTGQAPPEIDPFDTAEGSRMFCYPDSVSQQLRLAISQMMNPDYNKRPQNVEEVKSLLLTPSFSAISVSERPIMLQSDLGTSVSQKPIPQSIHRTVPPPVPQSSTYTHDSSKTIAKRIGLCALCVVAFVVVVYFLLNLLSVDNIQYYTNSDTRNFINNSTDIVSTQDSLSRDTIFPLTKLRGLNELDDYERNKFYHTYSSILDPLRNDPKAFNYIANFAYSMKRYQDVFGKDSMKPEYFSEEGAQYMDAMVKHKIINDNFAKRWSPYQNPFDPKPEERVQGKGMGSLWEKYSQMTDEGKLKLLQSEWLTPREFEENWQHQIDAFEGKKVTEDGKVYFEPRPMTGSLPAQDIFIKDALLGKAAKARALAGNDRIIGTVVKY